MKLMATAALMASALVVWTSTLNAANNWPNWRGPNYNGSIDGVSPPSQWSGEQNVQWKVDVPGRGSGSPIVWEDQIILLSAVDTGKTTDGRTPPPSDDASEGGRSRFRQPAPTTVHEFLVTSFDLSSGETRWNTVVTTAVPHEGGHGTNTFASSSAVTDGKHIFASFGSRGVYCLDMSGKVIWSKDLGRMETRNAFGEGSSPALIGDTLIVPWDHEGPSAVYALDATTGEQQWKTERDERTTWATPLAVTSGDQVQIVMNGSIVRSYDLKTGDLLWSCGGQVSNPIPCPVRFGDSVVCMTGYRGNAIYVIQLDAEGDVSDSEAVVWNRNDAAPYVSSPTLYKGQLYFTKERSGVMSSVDAESGEVVIPPTRLPGIRDVYASPVAADDKIYFTGRDGVTTVIRHGAEFDAIAENDLGEPVDASPAIVGDRILIRGAEHLYCIAETAQ